MGTNHSFLMQIWVFLGCCGSLQHNICKSLVVKGGSCCVVEKM